MGFWDTLKEVAKDVGKAAYDALEENAIKIQEYQEKYERMSIEQLEREYIRFKNGQISNLQKRAAFKRVCQERGLTKGEEL